MDLSIIVPCHNLENYLSDLLMSLKLQNIKDYEVELIFVCDACTDKTREVLENFDLSNFSSVQIIDADVKACGLARNVGLEEACGRYIWFLDGDDWLLDFNAITTALKLIEDKQVDILRVGFDCAYPDRFRFSMMVWQYVYSRELIGDIRFTNIQPNEDLEFMKLIQKKNPTMFFYPRKLYYYNFMREGSNMEQLVRKGRIDP